MSYHVTVAHQLAADALANVAFDCERDYFVARASVQAAIGIAFDLAAGEVRGDRALAKRIRSLVDAPSRRARPPTRACEVTRLQAFVERVTREMLEAWHGAYPTEAGVAKILEREFRAELLVHFSPADLRWLDENNS